MRIVIKVEYDGSAYAGWQYQNHSDSIQYRLEIALAKIAAHPVRVIGSGRTDAGVHALEQIAHFDTKSVRPTRAWVRGVNAHLPSNIRILWASPVGEEFHARYQAIARYYQYRILTRPVPSALLRKQVTWCYYHLDVEAMQQGAQFLVGEHDFSSFRGPYCQSRSPCRRVYLIDVQRQGEEVIVDIIGNAFLHNMVRNIVGVLMAIGSGKREPRWAQTVLEARDRTAGGVTAPPDGLFLGGVWYPDRFAIPRHPIFQRLPQNLKRIEESTFVQNPG